MSNNQNRGNIGANFHKPYFPQPSFNQGHNNNSILGTNPNSIPNPNLPNRPPTTNGNTDIRSRFRLPFEPTTTSTLPIYFFDSQLQQFVIPTTGRDQNPYGYLTVFGATTFKHLEILWKHKTECLKFIEERGLETNIPRYGASKTFDTTPRSSTTSTSKSGGSPPTSLIRELLREEALQ